MKFIVNAIKSYKKGFCFFIKDKDSCGKVCVHNCQIVCVNDCLCNSNSDTE